MTSMLPFFKFLAKKIFLINRNLLSISGYRAANTIADNQIDTLFYIRYKVLFRSAFLIEYSRDLTQYPDIC